MVRKTLKTLFLLLIAVFTLSTITEAAPKKAVRHRTPHSRRVAVSTTTAKKTTPRVTNKAAKPTRRAAGSAAAKGVDGSTATADKRPIKRRTTTKPH